MARGTGFVAAILAGIAAPTAQLAGVVDPVGLLEAGWIAAVGVALAVTGIAATVHARRDMANPGVSGRRQ